MTNLKAIVRLFRWERESQNTNDRQYSHNPKESRDENLDYERPGLEIHGPLSSADAEAARYREHERQHRNRQTLTNYFIAGFTAVTAAVGIWQGWLTRDAIRANDRQSSASEESNRVAKKSIESNLTQNRQILASSAKQTANVLTEAAKENRDALTAMQRQQELAFNQGRDALTATNKHFVADQRAWIGPQRFDTPRFEVGSPIKFQVFLYNYGKSVAREVYTLAESQPIQWGGVFIPKYDAINSRTAKSQSVVFPNGQIAIPLETNQIVSAQETSLVESGATVFYFYGIVTYKDNFGFGHKTTFCVTLSRDHQTLPACDSYNDAD